MRRETVPLVGLEHLVPKGVCCSHGQIGLDVGWLDVLELGQVGAIRSGVADVFVRAIHGALAGRGVVIADVEEGSVAVPKIVVGYERDRRKLDSLPSGGFALASNVVLRLIGPGGVTAGASSESTQSLKQVIGSAVLLDDDHDVSDLPNRETDGGLMRQTTRYAGNGYGGCACRRVSGGGEGQRACAGGGTWVEGCSHATRHARHRK